MRYIFVLLWLVVSVPAYGQITSISFGGGVGVSNFRGVEGDEDGSFVVKRGFNIGVSAVFRIQENLDLRIQTSYIQKGADIEIRFTDDDFFFDEDNPFGEGPVKGGGVSLDYVEISSLLRPRLPNMPIHFLIGPSIAINTGCNFSVLGIKVSCKDIMEGEASERKLDFGATAGIGWEKNFSDRVIVSADAQFTLGLRTLFKATEGLSPDDTESYDEDANPKSHSFALRVGVGFPIGKSKRTKDK